MKQILFSPMICKDLTNNVVLLIAASGQTLLCVVLEDLDLLSALIDSRTMLFLGGKMSQARLGTTGLIFSNALYFIQ